MAEAISALVDNQNSRPLPAHLAGDPYVAAAAREVDAAFDGMRSADREYALPDPTVPSPSSASVTPASDDWRLRAEAAEARSAETEKKLHTLAERTDLLIQRMQQAPQQAQAAPQAPEIPALERDPVGHIVERLNRQDQYQYAQAQWSQQAAQQAQAQQMLGALTQHAQAAEQAFERANPDYRQAVEHLQRVRHQELELVGFRDPAERARIITQEGLGVAARMIQAGGDPAAAIYNLAKLRGWGGPAEPPEPVRRAPSAARRLENIAAGQQQSRSLGGARGSGPRPMTAERALAMSYGEFDQFLKTPEGMELLGS